MSKSAADAESEKERQGKRAPQAPVSRKPPVSGHPEPHPPADAHEPERKAPAPPIANDLLAKAEQAAPVSTGGKMGPAPVAPQTVPAPESNPLGMTQPAREPAPKRGDAPPRTDEERKRR